MTNDDSTATTPTMQAALEAVEQGYTPIPIKNGRKTPYGVAWNQTRYENTADGLEKVREKFEEAAEHHAEGVGLLVGKPSGGLVDVDLDHPLALKLRDYFLPPSAMESGRASRPISHRWFQISDDDIPQSRPFKMPDGSMCVEFRSTGGQTVIPPSKHPSGESYRWEMEPWGGEEGPARIEGQKLLVQVAMLSMAAVLLEKWPEEGGRHEAYLNLAGGLLRYGDGVHAWWEKNLPVLIEGIADATHDDDAQTRVSEVVPTTITRIREGRPVGGFPKLAEIIGEDHAEQVRRRARELEHLAGYTEEPVRHLNPEGETRPLAGTDEEIVSTLPPEERNPLEERTSSWEAVDIWPFLTGQIVMPEPSVLRRSDGKGLLYPGRVNMIYGKSESAKSWISLYACVQEMSVGERTMYLDLEDEPTGSLARLKALGAADEDLLKLFRYVHPEGPLAKMQRNRFGANATDEGRKNESMFLSLLEVYDPTLIIVDGMTVLYGLHGLDTNDAMATDVITSWLKSLTRGGRSTVVVIDHTGKGGGAGAAPIGAHHKIAMVQGTAIRADAIDRPMPGAVGTINLVVHKDRPGAVRAISSTHDKEQIAGELKMDSREEGITRVTLAPPNANSIVVGGTDSQEQELENLSEGYRVAPDVLAMFEGDLDRDITTPEVVSELGLPAQVVRKAWHVLQDEGSVMRIGQTRNTRYRLIGGLDDV